MKTRPTTYDNAGRPTAIDYKLSTTTLGSFAYTRSTGGDVTGETVTGAGSNKAYTYNTLGQLATENSSAFGFDTADNLTAMSDGTTMTYDFANQVQSRTKGGVTTSFGHDNRGNRTSSTTNSVTTTLGYDQANRLTSFGSGATYAYDGGGLRTSKTVGTTTTAFTYDTVSGLPLVIDDGTNAYIYGPGGMLIEQVGATATTFAHQDQLGSTRLPTDSAGAVVATYQFDAYGNRAHTGTATTPMQYAGQYLDAESGLYWMRARYYEPTTGQFISRDPIVSVTRAAYSYVAGSPLNGTDPTGLLCFNNPFNQNDGGCVSAADQHRSLHTFRTGAAVVAVAAVAVAGVAVAASAAVGAGVTSAVAGVSAEAGLAATSAGAIAAQAPKIARTVDLGAKWLGPGVRTITNKAEDKIFLYADGCRRIRFDIRRPAPHKSPHAHVEELIKGQWQGSGPIYPMNVPHH